MTPDSINADSANEESSQNGQPHIPLTIDPYGGQALWPPGIYPFAHQHPGLYLPYPSPSTNGLPPFYPSLIEPHFNPQTFSAYYSQQQAAAAVRFMQEHGSLSGMSLEGQNINHEDCFR